MVDAYIYDHVRTPRGRGKPDGSLHTASTLRLAATALKAVKDRNHLNPLDVDDVVMGCVDPVGEAGGDIARMGALAAGFGQTVPGVQINRFCASGLDAVNFAASQVMSGQHDMTIGGGVESRLRWLARSLSAPETRTEQWLARKKIGAVHNRQHPDREA